jgi:hypothetical protein
VADPFTDHGLNGPIGARVKLGDPEPLPEDFTARGARIGCAAVLLSFRDELSARVVRAVSSVMATHGSRRPKTMRKPPRPHDKTGGTPSAQETADSKTFSASDRAGANNTIPVEADWLEVIEVGAIKIPALAVPAVFAPTEEQGPTKQPPPLPETTKRAKP